MAKQNKDENVMEARAVARYVRMAPKKVRLIIDQIRGKDIAQAQTILAYSERNAAETVAKVLNSAVANAENNHGMRANNLYIKTAYVDNGPTLKRIRARAKGSASRINKRTSHITIVVAPRKEA